MNSWAISSLKQCQKDVVCQSHTKCVKANYTTRLHHHCSLFTDVASLSLFLHLRATVSLSNFKCISVLVIWRRKQKSTPNEYNHTSISRRRLSTFLLFFLLSVDAIPHCLCAHFWHLPYTGLPERFKLFHTFSFLLTFFLRFFFFCCWTVVARGYHFRHTL